MNARLTETQKRSVRCPTCHATIGKPCRRQRGPHDLCDPPDHALSHSHDARREAAMDALPTPVIAVPTPRSIIVGLPSPSYDPVVWFVDGQRFDCSRESGACPFCCKRAVVRLPEPLRTIQPDGTTHVCVPTLGGCNHGFEDTRPNTIVGATRTVTA